LPIRRRWPVDSENWTYGGVATTTVAAILEGCRYLSIVRDERFHRPSQLRVRHSKIKRRAELMNELGFQES
jgi:hypothetical protein